MANYDARKSFTREIKNHLRRFNSVQFLDLKELVLGKHKWLLEDLRMMGDEIKNNDPSNTSELQFRFDPSEHGEQFITLVVSLRNPDNETTRFDLRLWEHTIDATDAWMRAQPLGYDPKFAEDRTDHIRELLQQRVLAWFDGTAT